MMKRTQIYIDEKTYSHLEKESRIKGVSVSAIIRESVKNKLSKRVERILKSTEKVCGLWKDRKPEDFHPTIRPMRARTPTIIHPKPLVKFATNLKVLYSFFLILGMPSVIILTCNI